MTRLHPRDALTRLRGRAALLADLRLLTEPAVLMLANLVGLRTLNAHAGAAAGDRLLREASAGLAELIGPAQPFRVGDDEFAWLVQPVPEDEAAYAAEVLAGWYAGKEPVQACLGWAPVSLGVSGERALAHAGLAVVSAKSTPSRIAGFTALDEAALNRRQSVQRALLDALRAPEGQLRLAFQPICSLADGRLVAVEALARWQHPTLGVVNPDEFVLLAEQTEMSCQLDRWVLARALSQVQDIPGHPVIHVNISASSLNTPGFTDEMLDLIGQSGVEPELLSIELTETALAGSALRLRKAVHTLHAAGLAISIDDFGTGHASWSYLSDFPVDELKLDKTFVQGLPHDTQRLAIVRAIIEVAHAGGQRVVAEGVETPEQARTLLALECDLGQGFLLGRPEAHVHLGPPIPEPRSGSKTVHTAHAPGVTTEQDSAQQLTDLARALSLTPPEPAAIFRLTMSALRRGLDFDGGSLQLAGPDGIRLAAADPPPPPEAFAARLPLGQGVAGTVLATGRPVYLPDITSSPAVPGKRRAISGGVRSYLAVPLFAQGAAIGVLQIDSTHVGAFSSADRLQLAAAGPLVAAALTQRGRLASVSEVGLPVEQEARHDA